MTCSRNSVSLLLNAAIFLVVSACSASSDQPKSHGNGSLTGGAGTVGAGAGTSGGVASSGATGNAGTTGTVGSGETCATADIQAARVTPTVWLVVDGSSSMQSRFGNGSRWTSLREALMDPNGGVVPKLQAGVVFGLIIYSGGQDINGGGGLFGGGLFGGGQTDAGTMSSDAGGGSCPELTIIDPALNNFTNMDGAFPQTQPGGTTPTQLALDQVSTRVSSPAQMLDKDQGPTYVVLATDGQPNGCDVNLAGGGGGTDPAAEQAVYDQVTKIVGSGTKLFAISLAGGDMALQAHLDQVAMLGNTGKPPFSPMSKDDLVKTFEEIIGGAVGCEVKLNGKVAMGSECQGTVTVNGNALPCNDPNGWRLKDAQTLEITGTACDDFRVNVQAQLHASFPCGVFIPD